MSTTTKERYARRKRLAANRFNQQRATPWSDSDDDGRRPPMGEEGQTDRQLSDMDSQNSGPASFFRIGQLVEPPMTTPAAPAVIPMEALLAITQALKLSNT